MSRIIEDICTNQINTEEDERTINCPNIFKEHEDIEHINTPLIDNIPWSSTTPATLCSMQIPDNATPENILPLKELNAENVLGSVNINEDLIVAQEFAHLPQNISTDILTNNNILLTQDTGNLMNILHTDINSMLQVIYIYIYIIGYY